MIITFPKIYMITIISIYCNMVKKLYQDYNLKLKKKIKSLKKCTSEEKKQKYSINFTYIFIETKYNH